MRKSLLCLIFLYSQLVYAQKKPLDHTVYDSWQSIGEKSVSNNGQWLVYSIQPQEGDNELVVQSSDATYRRVFPRGTNAVFSDDSRFVIFRIRPYFKDLRDARIKKKRADDMPKDSLAILSLADDRIWKMARVKNYKAPTDSYGWVAYHLEKSMEAAPRTRATTTDPRRTTDSLTRIIDSLHQLIQEMPKKKKKNKDGDGGDDTEYINASDAEGDDPPTVAIEAGTNLILRKLSNGEERVFSNVLEYAFNKKGQKLLLEIARMPKDSTSRALVLLYDLNKGFADTLSRGGNDFKNFTLSEDGSKVAYIAERDAKPKDLQKFYKLWHYSEGMDSAKLLVDKNAVGMKLGMTISEFAQPYFSKSGKRLFFGTAPIQPPRDTSIVESEQAKLDIWHYNDDYLQSVQLFRLQRDLQENFLAVYLFDSETIQQLGSKDLPIVITTNEGDGAQFVGVTDVGKRIESQWMGNTKKDIYTIQVDKGESKLIKNDMTGIITPTYVSPSGRYIMWYDTKAKNYFIYDGDSIRNLTSKVKVSLFNEEHDSPSDPAPYGVMGWHEGDSAVYVYDRFDAWKLNLASRKDPVNIFGPAYSNRKNKTVARYVNTNADKRYIRQGEVALFRVFDDDTKTSGYNLLRMGVSGNDSVWITSPYNVSGVAKAKDAPVFVYSFENYQLSPNLKVATVDTTTAFAWSNSIQNGKLITSLNLHQKDYNWGTAELFKWKTFKGKDADGIVYKPEDFDPNKKYPVILYFYEELSDGLNTYLPPTPTGSKLNISFFVSRGYIVFAPDVKYTIGHPAKSAYDYIVSGAQSLAKNKWIDAKNMGIQGQSWGGIQVAQLITMTDMFKAAWAGAPVVNMTSAYGGIRWESGVNRQFQYERTQSRIGATLWEKPELYIENSPLFHLPKVKTPLVIMSNDADGAVPWYQGIEFFTAMRRLGKKVWLLNYNGEAHNLVDRKNKKDIQIREQQYFDWLLKGERPAKWITQGVPAVRKGKDLGLELVD
ncbi:MAG: S9 family peptidase [Chitinophagaceae bacterium]|nr:S9 family peptidase [Chitinophagaceae bacterium]